LRWEQLELLGVSTLPTLDSLEPLDSLD
jgi:hypothetical protein